MQVSELAERERNIEPSIHHASRTCHAPNAPYPIHLKSAHTAVPWTRLVNHPESRRRIGTLLCEVVY